MALDPLYQELLLEHYKHPRNFGKLEAPTCRTRRDNPLCGDHIDLHLAFSPGGNVRSIKFHGRGCVISQASASMMTAAVQGKSVAQARGLLASFEELFAATPAASNSRLGELAVFAVLRDFPSRVSCAILPWQALAHCLPAGDSG